MDQKKLMFRIKNKTDQEKLTISSMMYFVADTAVFTVTDMIRQKCSLMMAWLEEDALKMKVLYEPSAAVTIGKMLNKSDKGIHIVMLSDGALVILSMKDPKGVAPQVVKQQAKFS
ncbi:MAG: hypothetical protein AB1805_08115 [Nitrospirota bacterium]